MQEEERVDAVEEPINETQNSAEKTMKTEPSAETETSAEEKEAAKGGLFSRKGNKDKAKIQELEVEIEKLKVEKAELNDRFLRMYSEFDNYKKRVSKEKLDLLSTASEKVIVNLLPVIDDYERAIAANEKVDDINSVKEGFVLIYNKLQKLLKRFDVEEIDAKGEEFDTNFHEAITQFPTDKEEEKGKVIDVTQKGYKIKEKVIRYAKVVVGL